MTAGAETDCAAAGFSAGGVPIPGDPARIAADYQLSSGGRLAGWQGAACSWAAGPTGARGGAANRHTMHCPLLNPRPLPPADAELVLVIEKDAVFQVSGDACRLFNVKQHGSPAQSTDTP